MMIVPGADGLQLYQATHKLAYNLQEAGGRPFVAGAMGEEA